MHFNCGRRYGEGPEEAEEGVAGRIWPGASFPAEKLKCQQSWNQMFIFCDGIGRKATARDRDGADSTADSINVCKRP